MSLPIEDITSYPHLGNTHSVRLAQHETPHHPDQSWCVEQYDGSYTPSGDHPHAQFLWSNYSHYFFTREEAAHEMIKLAAARALVTTQRCMTIIHPDRIGIKKFAA